MRGFHTWNPVKNRATFGFGAGGAEHGIPQAPPE
jgi:hypothetical protein